MRDLPLGIRPRLINKTPQEAVAIPAAASCRYINSRPVRTPDGGVASLSVGYATLTHGYILADARLASCPDAFAPRYCEYRSRTHRVECFALCIDAWASRYRYCDNHAAANVRWGRDPGGECRRDLARGERSVTPGHQRTPQKMRPYRTRIVHSIWVCNRFATVCRQRLFLGRIAIRPYKPNHLITALPGYVGNSPPI